MIPTIPLVPEDANLARPPDGHLATIVNRKNPHVGAATLRFLLNRPTKNVQ